MSLLIMRFLELSAILLILFATVAPLAIIMLAAISLVINII